MKKLIFSLLIAAMCVIGPANASGTTIAVLTSQNSDDRIQTILGQQVADTLSGVILKYNHFELVERAQTDALLREMKLQLTSVFDDSTVAAIGNQSGAQLVAVSSFMISSDSERNEQGAYTYKMRLAVKVRFVDVATGTVEFSTDVDAGASNYSSSGPIENPESSLISGSLVDLGRKFDRVVAAQYPNLGYVIKVISQTEYLIDVGKNKGAAAKDPFIIFIEGQPIAHPVTGELLKGEKTILGEGTISVIGEDTSTLKLKKKPQRPIEVGIARVQSKPKPKGFMESLEDFTR